MVGLPKPTPRTAVESISCSNCGTQNQATHNFCSDCGTKL
ncbi:zinc-ribbon domain-containing protein [Anabaena sp. UHCC 0187]|nr:zinc-ribbon domain-containing protein [Anabaena sp. UHCC 0187]